MEIARDRPFRFFEKVMGSDVREHHESRSGESSKPTTRAPETRWTTTPESSPGTLADEKRGEEEQGEDGEDLVTAGASPRKNPSAGLAEGCVLVDLWGLEPQTSALRTQRSPS